MRARSILGHQFAYLNPYYQCRLSHFNSILFKISQETLKQLRPILKSLNEDDWLKLDPIFLSAFRSLSAFTINYPFLHWVVQFWDPRKHVFCFNNFEICPLLEEFGAILGYLPDSSQQIATPWLRTPDLPGILQFMAQLLNLPPHLFAKACFQWPHNFEFFFRICYCYQYHGGVLAP